MTIRAKEDLISYLENYSDDTPIVIFDDYTGEYKSIEIEDDYISKDTSWARYSAHVLIVGINKE